MHGELGCASTRGHCLLLLLLLLLLLVVCPVVALLPPMHEFVILDLAVTVRVEHKYRILQSIVIERLSERRAQRAELRHVERAALVHVEAVERRA